MEIFHDVHQFMNSSSKYQWLAYTEDFSLPLRESVQWLHDVKYYNWNLFYIQKDKLLILSAAVKQASHLWH